MWAQFSYSFLCYLLCLQTHNIFYDSYYLQMDHSETFLDSNRAKELGTTILRSISPNTLKSYSHKIRLTKHSTFLGLSNGLLTEQDFSAFANSELAGKFTANAWKTFKSAAKLYARVNGYAFSSSFEMFLEGKIREKIPEHMPSKQTREISKQEFYMMLRTVIAGPDEKSKFQTILAMVLGWACISRLFDQSRLKRRHFQFDQHGVTIFFQTRKNDPLLQHKQKSYIKRRSQENNLCLVLALEYALSMLNMQPDTHIYEVPPDVFNTSVQITRMKNYMKRLGLVTEGFSINILRKAATVLLVQNVKNNTLVDVFVGWRSGNSFASYCRHSKQLLGKMSMIL